jgi:hypothetical protein
LILFEAFLSGMKDSFTKGLISYLKADVKEEVSYDSIYQPSHREFWPTFIATMSLASLRSIKGA